MRRQVAVVLAMLCVLAFCIAPVTASVDLVAKQTGMTVAPIIGDVIWPKGSNTGSVSQGGSESFSYTVSPGETVLKVKVVWGTTTNNLGLNVIIPDGTTFGEYDDYTGSSTADGAVAIQFKDSVALISGKWIFYVNGKSVSGSQPYTITVISS